MTLSATQVLVASAALSLVFAAAAWGSSDEPAPWTRPESGSAYRDPAREDVIKAPARVSFAAIAAVVLIVVSVLRALHLALEVLGSEREVTIAGVECSSFPCDPPERMSYHTSDTTSAIASGLALIATCAVIGAFARWARDAPVDKTQARRAAPLFAAGGLVLAYGLGALFASTGDWMFALPHVGVALVAAILVAVARRSVVA